MSEKKYIEELAKVIAKMNDKKLVQGFLTNILTPAELEEVARRLQIFKMLKKGIPQREIAAKLGVSIGTISRGSRELQFGSPSIHQVLS